MSYHALCELGYRYSTDSQELELELKQVHLSIGPRKSEGVTTKGQTIYVCPLQNIDRTNRLTKEHTSVLFI